MRKVAFIVLIFLAKSACAEVLEANANDDGKTRIELGACLGFPALFNATAGIWFEQGLVTRISGFPWYFVNGVQADVGFATVRDAQSRQFVALSAGYINMSRAFGDESYTFIGPKYEFNWGGIFFDIGVAYAWGSGKSPAFHNEVKQRNSILPQFQLGFTPVFF